MSANRSPYDASILELLQRFAISDHRTALLRNLIAYRQLLASDDYRDGYQFIDGSFVEDVETLQNRAPNDIDLVSFLRLPEKYPDRDTFLAAGFAFWRDEVAALARNQQRFQLHTYAYLLPTVTFRDITYWHGLFSHQRDTFAWKGYIVVQLDPTADQAALAAVESA